MENDYLEHLGPAALSQLLRRLQETITTQNQARFHAKGVPVPPVTVSTVLYLQREGEKTVTDISRALRLSHPRVLKFLAILEGAGLVSIQQDLEDGRRKNISLNADGKALAERLEADRQELESAFNGLFQEIGVDLADAAGRALNALEKKSLSMRVAALASDDDGRPGFTSHSIK